GAGAPGHPPAGVHRPAHAVRGPHRSARLAAPRRDSRHAHRGGAAVLAALPGQVRLGGLRGKGRGPRRSRCVVTVPRFGGRGPASGSNAGVVRRVLGRPRVFQPAGGSFGRGGSVAEHRRLPRPWACGPARELVFETPSCKWFSGFHFVPARESGRAAVSGQGENPHSGPGSAPARGNRSLVGRTVRPIGVFWVEVRFFGPLVGHPVGAGWQRGTGGSPGRGRAARPETWSSKLPPESGFRDSISFQHEVSVRCLLQG